MRKTISFILLLLYGICLPSCIGFEDTIPDAKPCNGMPTITFAGKQYPTVQIGNQCWLSENLSIGLMISADQKMTDNGIIEKYCCDNDTSNCTVYGGLYQWDEMMQYITDNGTRGICPQGWHIPTIDEWFELSEYLGKDYWAGEMLKDNTTGYWAEPNLTANNGSGFNALPSGTWFADSTFSNKTNKAYFWSSTELDTVYAWNRILNHADTKFREVATKKENARSVRCIKDQ